MSEKKQEISDSSPEEETKKIKENSNIVFVGTKPFMNYINSVEMQFDAKNRDEVVIKARGKFINRAVDIAEVAKKRPLGNKKIEIKNIKTDSEEFENKEGKKVKVSTIEITLKKK